MNIIPVPKNAAQYTEGAYLLKPISHVFLDGFTEVCTEAFAYRTKTAVLPTQHSNEADLLLQRNPKYAKERYLLEVTPDQIRITAEEKAGVIAALTTLYLCLNNGSVPCFTLDDSPRFGHRGLSMDCVRHFFEISEIKKIIEQLSLVKLNVFHWHLTNDQGWRIESKVFPQLHQLNGQPYYSQQEILEIIQFAKIRGIEVIPEIDLPGHTTAAIAAYPHLSCQGKQLAISTQRGGIHKIIMCAGKESTYKFVFALLDEICDLFESPRIHIGGDEAPKDEWKNCEDCKRRLAAIGGENMEDLQGDFTIRVTEYLRSKGKTTLCWNEVLHTKHQPKNIEIQSWIEHNNEEEIQTYFKNGGKMIFSDMLYYYLDYPHSMSSLKRVYAYEPKIGKMQCKDAHNTLGVECCVWDENIETTQRLEEQLFPRLFAMADRAWSNKNDYEDFVRRLPTHLSALEQAEMHYTSLEDSNPTEAERIKYLNDLKRRFAAAFSADGDASPSSVDFLNFLTEGFQLPVNLATPLDE